jgi:hypothetical protein
MSGSDGGVAPNARADAGESTNASETLIDVLPGIVKVVLGSVAGRRRHQGAERVHFGVPETRARRV